ncbi:MAG TPA: hypothetical protein VKU00_24140, partial [Chthonomonadaceae bacterium]|nr:hypothetical protein [Chthonomonadaceae bacterium]
MRNHRKFWCVLSPALLVVVLAIWCLSLRTPLLLQRATRIADTTAWYGGERFNEDIGVHWLSDHELLYSKFEGPQSQQRVLYRRDLQTGQEIRLPGLTQSREKFEAECVDDQDVSPDGKWYLCSARWGECLLAEVTGTRYFTYPYKNSEDYRHLYWSADSRYWAENFSNDWESHQLQLYDIENPRSSVSLSLAGREGLIGFLTAIISPQRAIAVQLPDETDDGTPLTDNRAVVTLFSLTDSRTPVTVYRIKPPNSALCRRLAISPRGERI